MSKSKYKKRMFYDTTTGAFFYSTFNIIADHVRDIFYDISYFRETPYVELIRELQKRLGIPQISDITECCIYSKWDGYSLIVRYSPGMLEDGTEFYIIRYDHLY